MNDLAYLIERSAKLNSEKMALIGNGQLLSFKQSNKENYSVHIDNQDLCQISYFTDTKGNSKGTIYNWGC
ncbi:hypothetical protein JMM81_13885 [Bacillus sp. V3B]|uniref:hypothetical protein n=1 Tax=Bacillus sp. V3B TaxID=2804915 RepID=UPI00210D814B|nr:hypothetical protein [Bacillus sp. V3B]MCQ6276027.1 hypothetical protein [Bacillus sp. V3B]